MSSNARCTVTATGRCRAYPRKNAHLFESFQTAGTLGFAFRPACRTGNRMRSRSSECSIGAPHARRGGPSTRPHPREDRGMGNVYSGVVRASLYRDFTAGELAGISLSGVCVTAVESRPAGVARDEPEPGGHRPFGARVKAFVALTKPRIIELLLITTVPVMFLAAAGRARPVAGARSPASAATSPRAAPTR